MRYLVYRDVRIVSAAAGNSHSMGLAADGTLYTWGDSQCGQLGHEEIQSMMLAVPDHPLLMLVPQAIQCLRPEELKSHERYGAVQS